MRRRRRGIVAGGGDRRPGTLCAPGATRWEDLLGIMDDSFEDIDSGSLEVVTCDGVAVEGLQQAPGDIIVAGILLSTIPFVCRSSRQIYMFPGTDCCDLTEFRTTGFAALGKVSADDSNGDVNHHRRPAAKNDRRWLRRSPRLTVRDAALYTPFDSRCAAVCSFDIACRASSVRTNALRSGLVRFRAVKIFCLTGEQRFLDASTRNG